jgi:hypothetical protein
MDGVAAGKFAAVLPVGQSNNFSVHEILASIGLGHLPGCQLLGPNGALQGNFDVSSLGADGTVTAWCPRPALPLNYTFQGQNRNISLEIAGSEQVFVTKCRLLKATQMRDYLPTVLKFSFWQVELANENDILSYGIPSGCIITWEVREVCQVSVDYNGAYTFYCCQESTAGELVQWIAHTEQHPQEDIILESEGSEFPHSASLAHIGSRAVTVVMMKNFEFTTEFGPVILRLRKTATVADAREALAQRLQKTSDLLHFARDGQPIDDLSAQLEPLGKLSVSFLAPTQVSFNGLLYAVMVEYTIEIKDLKRLVSEAIGGQLAVDEFDLTFERMTLDDDMTLTDAEYGPLSPPIVIEPKAKPAPAPARSQAPSAPAPSQAPSAHPRSQTPSAHARSQAPSAHPRSQAPSAH